MWASGTRHVNLGLRAHSLHLSRVSAPTPALPGDRTTPDQCGPLDRPRRGDGRRDRPSLGKPLGIGEARDTVAVTPSE
jgi:hypothetical protein